MGKCNFRITMLKLEELEEILEYLDNTIIQK